MSEILEFIRLYLLASALIGFILFGIGVYLVIQIGSFIKQILKRNQ